jgi:hypothetical protein
MRISSSLAKTREALDRLWLAGIIGGMKGRIQLGSGRVGGRLIAVMLVGLVSLLIAASAAYGHGKSISYSSWTLAPAGGDVHDVSVRITRIELSRLGMGAQTTPQSLQQSADYIADHLVMRAGDAICERVAPARAKSRREGWLAIRFSVRCPEGAPLAGAPISGAPLSIQSSILLEAAPSHLHFARVRQAGDATDTTAASGIRERVLSGKDAAWVLASVASMQPGSDAPASGSSLAHYVGLGVEHILSGWDHLAFVIALLLLARSLSEVALLVTGFTLAHSATLVLAVLGVLHPDPPAVEAVIGFSVALVAIESGWELTGRDRRVPSALATLLLVMLAATSFGLGALTALSISGLLIFSLCHFGLLSRVEDPSRVRVALAFCFGLVHGFGFAGVLAEMALPTGRLVPALFGFNIGVELGQLVVVGLAWPGLRLLKQLGSGGAHRAFAELASAGICGLGLYWFMLRTLGAAG